MKKISIEVNGKKIKKEVPDHTILSVLLRDILNLTGTHIGCDTSQCGACVVRGWKIYQKLYNISCRY